MSDVRTIVVVIPTFGRPDRAASLVTELLSQCNPDDTINVVWQGETAPKVPQVKQVTLLHSQPPNLPRARNIGFSNSKADVVLFLDDDVVPEKGLLDAHRRVYDNNQVGAVAGFIDDTIFTSDRSVPSRYDERTGELVQNFSVEKSRFAVSMMGANMSIRRNLLENIGGFDTNFTRNALWEEIDCAFRIREQGYAIWFCADARVRHLRENDGGCRADSGHRYLFHQFANTAYFAGKHAPRKNLRSWLTFWKYRLEYLARNGRHAKGKNSHDLSLVLTGVIGACCGIARYTGYLISNLIFHRTK